MSSCSCSPDTLTSVTFGNGTVLLRCPAHEAQRWLVDGQPVAVGEALEELRSLFVEQRGARPARRPTGGHAPRRQTRASQEPVRPTAPAACPPRVIHLPTSAASAGPDSGPAEHEALTALLNARGLTGSWAVA